jgi:hypothetical protein
MRPARQPRDTPLFLARNCYFNFVSFFAINNPLDYNFPMLTIAELPEYIRRAEKLLSASERNELA